MYSNPFETPEYKKNTSEQYEALGRFITSFEAMAHEARMGSISLLSQNMQDQTFLRIPFYNHSLTAKPLWEILRTLIAEIINDADTIKHLKITPETQGVYNGVLRTITTEYTYLCDLRNDLIHGTWFVEFLGGPTNSSSDEFVVHRMEATKKGLSPVELPKTAQDLLAYADRCAKTADWIHMIAASVGFLSVTPPGSVFKNVNGKWCRMVDGKPQTLPQTLA